MIMYTAASRDGCAWDTFPDLAHSCTARRKLGARERTEFSLLTPDNAPGFTKIVQRIPVKIVPIPPGRERAACAPECRSMAR